MLSGREKTVTFTSRTGKESSLGITVIELVITVAIVATLAAIAFPAYNKYRDNANIVHAIADIRTVEHDIYIYEGYNAKLPDLLDDIGQGNLRDPWGNPYQYLNNATKKGKAKPRFDKLFKPLNLDFDLYSMGKDGQTESNLDKSVSLDDIVRALNGEFVGLASEY